MTRRRGEVIVHQHELNLGLGDVVGEVEIGERLNVQPQTVAQWCIRSKGHHGKSTRAGRRAFPPARWTVSKLPAWYWPEVAEWAKRTGRLPPDPPEPRPGQADTPKVRLIGGVLDGITVEHPDAGAPFIELDAGRNPTLDEVDVAGPIPVRCTYKRAGADDDGTASYLHHQTEDLVEARTRAGFSRD